MPTEPKHHRLLNSNEIPKDNTPNFSLTKDFSPIRGEQKSVIKIEPATNVITLRDEFADIQRQLHKVESPGHQGKLFVKMNQKIKQIVKDLNGTSSV